MGLGRCRACGGGNIRRSSVWRTHLLRTILDSPRRYCGSCQERWISAEPASAARTRKVLLAVVCFSLAGMILGGVHALLRRSSRAQEETAGAEAAALIGGEFYGMPLASGGADKPGFFSLIKDAASLVMRQAMGMLGVGEQGPGSAEGESASQEAP